MKNKIKACLKGFIIAFYLIPCSMISQEVQIETTNLQIVDNKLEITYDFIKSKKTQRYEVWIEINNSKDEKLNVRAVSGDIGANQMGGKNKKITWDYNADGMVLDDEFSVEVKASISIVEGAIKPSKVFLQSIVLPGWGITSMEKGKPYWLIGVVGYASLGGSLLLRSSYKNNYDKYLTAIDPTESNNLYDKSHSQQSLSQVFTYAAIGTWAISTVWTLIKVNKVNNSLVMRKNRNELLFYSNYNPATKTTGFTLKYNF